MKTTNRLRLPDGPWLARGGVALFTAVLGIFLLLHPAGGGLARLSFDLPFSLRPNRPLRDVALVYMDAESYAVENQPLAGAWERTLHARLVDSLVAQGAKAIVFDVHMNGPGETAAADEQFARAIQRSQRVILCGNYVHSETHPEEQLPFEDLRKAAVGWGNMNLVGDDDDAVRECWPNFERLGDYTNILSLSWAAAAFAGAPATRNAALSTGRWLNFYAPPAAIPGTSYSQALQQDRLPPGTFAGKVVFVGSRQSVGFFGSGKDEFRTPYRFSGGVFAPGVQFHATAAQNLIDGSWLTRLHPAAEKALVVVVGVLAGLGLMRCAPLSATLLAGGGGLLLAITACLGVWFARVWFAWLVPVVEIGGALGCAVVYSSLRLHIERKVLEQALASHLSPGMVKRLVREPALRRVGGTQQEISILFTDIANFSRVSEAMSPDDLVRLLNQYYAATLKCVHETDGTVVQLIGDAIYAIWNAPLPQPDHRERAARAALRLREQLLEFGETQRGLPMRTRVGVHAGVACVGNIGSATRFDYTAIGDNVNLTSRLEGLNKQLGTTVVASREIQRVAEHSLVWRLVGHFKFKGFGRAVEVYELIGPIDDEAASRAWREPFADALNEFRQRRWDSASAKFRAVIETRGGQTSQASLGTEHITGDGPSGFYLRKIEEFRVRPPAEDWIGEVALGEK